MNAGTPVESPGAGGLARRVRGAARGNGAAERPPPRAGRPYLGGKAADQVRRDEYNQHGRSGTETTGKSIKGTRYSLLKDTAKQTAKQLLKLAEVVLTNKRMYRAFLLYGELRYIYRLPKHEAPERLDAWLAWASRSRLKPFIKLARTIRKHKAGVLAAIELGLSNGRLEALNSKVRLLSHRATIPLRRRADRDNLPLLRRHPDRAPSPMNHPQTERRASFPDVASSARCQAAPPLPRAPSCSARSPCGAAPGRRTDIRRAGGIDSDSVAQYRSPGGAVKIVPSGILVLAPGGRLVAEYIPAA